MLAVLNQYVTELAISRDNQRVLDFSISRTSLACDPCTVVVSVAENAASFL